MTQQRGEADWTTVLHLQQEQPTVLRGLGQPRPAVGLVRPTQRVNMGLPPNTPMQAVGVAGDPGSSNTPGPGSRGCDGHIGSDEAGPPTPCFGGARTELFRAPTPPQLAHPSGQCSIPCAAHRPNLLLSTAQATSWATQGPRPQLQSPDSAAASRYLSAARPGAGKGPGSEHGSQFGKEAGALGSDRGGSRGDGTRTATVVRAVWQSAIA